MPARKPLRRMLFRNRGISAAAVATPSPEFGSPPSRPMGVAAEVLRSWNNTEADDEMEAGGEGGEGEGGNCSQDQRQRLVKCQKSLEELEFSLNNLLLNMSLASDSGKNQRRMEEADRFFTDLVDSVRANRSTRRRQERWQAAKAGAAAAASAGETAPEMQKRLLEESRALWRAQHIGARCEDTVDRYMLDVVIDRLGEMADVPKEPGGRRGQRQQPEQSGCGKCGASGWGGGANKHNSCFELASSTEHCRHRASVDEADNFISFRKRMRPSDTSGGRRGRDSQRKLLMQLRPLQQQQLQLRSKSDARLTGSRNNKDVVEEDEEFENADDHDRWTLRTWQPPPSMSIPGRGTPAAAAAAAAGSNNNNCGDVEVPLKAPPPEQGRRTTDLVASVAAYQLGSKRYEKALRVAAYLRDMCRQFYRTSCSGRAPPAAHDLEAAMRALTELVAMRDRAVALVVRCTACPALCAAERWSSPQLCRLRALLRLGCIGGGCSSGPDAGVLDLVDALASADRSADRCRLLRRLRQVTTQAGDPSDANYKRLINALANLKELDNCSVNYQAHRRRMCGTVPAMGPGPRGITRADMRALAIDLVAEAADGDTAGQQPCKRRQRMRRSSPLAEALHNPEEMRRRLRMHKFATGAALSVKANEYLQET